MVCPLAPSPGELYVTAAEIKTTQRWLISIPFANHHMLVLALAAYVGLWRVGANGKITSDTYWSAQYFWALIYDHTMSRFEELTFKSICKMILSRRILKASPNMISSRR